METTKYIRYSIVWATFSACILFAGIVGAEMFKWVDENGVAHFSDTPTQQAPESENEDEKEVVEEKIVTVEAAPQAIPLQKSSAQPAENDLDAITKVIEEIAKGQAEMAAQNRPAVELFVTSWCVYCKKAKAFFRSRRIRFAEYDIEKDPAAARRMSKMTSSKGVPFAIINGRPIQGFSESAYKRALQK